MIKKWFLVNRDFSHVFLKKQNNTDKTGYPIYLFIVFFPYYFIVLALMGGLINRTGFNFTLLVSTNILFLGLLIVILFGSPILFTKWIVDWLRPIPLPTDLDKRRYRWYAVVFILTFLLGFVLIPIAVNSFDYIWPPNDFSKSNYL